MRRWIKRSLITTAVLVATGLAAAFWALGKTKHVPEFYTRATKALPESTKEASQHLEADVETLQQEVASLGFWEAEFNDAEVNAWLIEELPKKFPHLLAKGASDPRIVIEDHRLLAAVRYQNSQIDTVVSCEFSVELTEQPNMLALQVKNLRAGALPLPLVNFAMGISKEAAKGGIEIRWDVTETGPVALVTVPSEHPRYVLSPVIVESVRFRQGKLVLSGHTGPLAHESYSPQGPVHQFVSFRPRARRSRQTSRLPADSPTKFR